MMGRIYQEANLVLAWLGPADPALSLAVRTLNLLGAALENGKSSGLGSTRSIPGLWQEVDGSLNAVWKGVGEFLLHPLWSRIWVLQEMVFANRLWIFNGSNIVTWKRISACCDLCDKIIEGKLERPEFVPIYCWHSLSISGVFPWGRIKIVQLFRSIWRRDGRLESVELLMIVNRHHASDPRDMVYAFSGLLNMGIEPDYDLSVKEVFHDYACKCIESSGNLKILCYTGLEGSNEDSIPSWVPILSDTSWKCFLPSAYFLAEE